MVIFINNINNVEVKSNINLSDLNDDCYVLGNNCNKIQTTFFSSFIKELPYITYTFDFPSILDTDIDSDVGWGCMIRSGQMLLCNVLLNCFQSEKDKIWDIFNDKKECLLSIHNISEIGSYMGTNIGSWFSPTLISLSLEMIVNEEMMNNFKIIVFKDGLVNEIDLDKNISENTILVLMPIMLGLNEVCEKYCKALCYLFTEKIFYGIVGGKPKASMYFVGCCRDELISLNPHNVKKFNETQKERYVDKIDLINVKNIDPSMVLSFLIKNKEDINNLKNIINYLSKNYNFPVSIGESKYKNVDQKSDGEWEVLI